MIREEGEAATLEVVYMAFIRNLYVSWVDEVQNKLWSECAEAFYRVKLGYQVYWQLRSALMFVWRNVRDYCMIL